MNSLHQTLEWRILCGVGLAALIFAVGCGGGRATADYMPESNQARQAVEQMLEAWKKGEAVKGDERLSAKGPALKFMERQRDTKKLASYEIVSDKPATTDQPPQVAVKLTFTGEQKQVDAVYYVIGIDPLNVFRDIDYQQASGMTN